MIVIVLLAVMTYCNMVTSVELSTNEEYIKELNEYKEIVSSKENTTCKDFMNNLINKTEKSISKTEMDLRGTYEEIMSDSLLDYYSKGAESCKSITKEQMQDENLPIKFLGSTVLVDETISKYFFQYELSFKDIKMRDYSEVSLEAVGNNIKIQNELQIIQSFLNIIDWEKEV